MLVHSTRLPRKSRPQMRLQRVGEVACGDGCKGAAAARAECLWGDGAGLKGRKWGWGARQPWPASHGTEEPPRQASVSACSGLARPSDPAMPSRGQPRAGRTRPYQFQGMNLSCDQVSKPGPLPGSGKTGPSWDTLPVVSAGLKGCPNCRVDPPVPLLRPREADPMA